MADDVTFTAGANATPPGGTKAATDDITVAGDHQGSQMGMAKLAVSANGDGTHIPATATDGLLVNLGTNNDVTVTGSVTTGGLTDAQLRATAVPVDGSGVTQPVSNAGLTALNGAIAGTEVQADIVAALPAGTNNIGDVDIASLPNEGQQTMLNSISVAVASDQSAIPVSGTVATGGLTDAELRATPVPVSGTVAVTNAGLTALNGAIAGTEVQVDVVAPLPAGTNNIGDVDVASLPALPAGTNNIGDVDVVTLPDVAQATAANLNAQVVGNIAHDGVDSGNPVKVGAKAVAFGANPTGVAANDRTDVYASRAGIPFVLGGHPNIITLEAAYTAAQTDTAIVTVAGGAKIVVTEIEAVLDEATTVGVGFRVGFAAANTPTTTGVVLTHPGLVPGGGITRGSGAGVLGVGADGEDLRITSEVPTGGSLRILVSYFTIES